MPGAVEETQAAAVKVEVRVAEELAVTLAVEMASKARAAGIAQVLEEVEFAVVLEKAEAVEVLECFLAAWKAENFRVAQAADPL